MFFLFYIIALIPAIIGAILFMFHRKVIWTEWLGGTAIAFIVSGIMHVIALLGQVDDIECWSGQIVYVSHCPEWVEEYTETHVTTSTDSEGDVTVTTYTTTEHSTHDEKWLAYLNFGTISEEREISQEFYKEAKKNFGSKEENAGKQEDWHGGHFDGGDDNIYTVKNYTKYVYPVTALRHFENRIKAAPTVFSFVKVPPTIKVYEWPSNPNWRQSDRLLGESRISILEFDRMNSRLGPRKKVNVIMLNFGLQDRSIAEWQRAKYIGGKKNDIVICYGQLGTNNIPTWCSVFGWSEREICKRNLESILLANPINNDLLSQIEKEIVANYQIKDWTKFDYISVDPPTWAYIALAITMLLTQGTFWIWAHYNEFTKDDNEGRYRNSWQ
jgi:hypothetical protein